MDTKHIDAAAYELAWPLIQRDLLTPIDVTAIRVPIYADVRLLFANHADGVTLGFDDPPRPTHMYLSLPIMGAVDAETMMGVLAHEMIHTAYMGLGHDTNFYRAAFAIGLKRKPGPDGEEGATVPDVKFSDWYRSTLKPALLAAGYDLSIEFDPLDMMRYSPGSKEVSSWTSLDFPQPRNIKEIVHSFPRPT